MEWYLRLMIIVAVVLCGPFCCLILPAHLLEPILPKAVFEWPHGLGPALSPVGVAIVYLPLGLCLLWWWAARIRRRERAHVETLRLPEISEIVALEINLPISQAKFAVQQDDWLGLLAALASPVPDPAPYKWELLATLTVRTQNGPLRRICVYRVEDDLPAAFSVEIDPDIKRHFRGGNMGLFNKNLAAASRRAAS